MEISNLKSLQNRVYELEGLIELAINRNLPAQLASLIADKCAEIAGIAEPWRNVAATDEEPEGLSGYADSQDYTDSEPDDDFNHEPEPAEDSELAPNDDPEPEFDEDNYFESELEAGMVPTDEADEAYESEEVAVAPETTFEFVESPETRGDENPDDTENLEDPETTEESGPVEPEEPDPVADRQELTEQKEVKPDPGANHIRRRSLESYLSLNDKFRFRRELFAGSVADLAASLRLVNSMAALTEAEDYFYNDLQWDPNSTEVQAFMSIVTQYFNQ